MKVSDVLNVLGELVISQNTIRNQNFELTDVTIKLQNAKSSDIVFYKLSPNQKSLDAFKQRIIDHNAGLVILSKVPVELEWPNCVMVSEEKFLEVQELVCNLIYPNKNKMKLVGVTGTNGKTTTVNLAMQISKTLGHPAISVGTIGVFNDEAQLLELDSTTPSYIELRKIIYNYQDKYEAMFLEVSSHALVQNRLGDLILSEGAFTSFSQDHLDYHISMDEYFDAKLLMVQKYLNAESKLILPKSENELIQKISKKLESKKFMLAKTFDELNIHEYPLFYRSSYNKSNAELALELNAQIWKIDLKNFDLSNVKTPKGRFSIIKIGETAMAIIDYAHTPDALLNVGDAIKKAFPRHKIVTLFGCGGNRDKTKRPLMGKAVTSFSDRIMITSDNPRDEVPEDIIVDIIQGIETHYEAMVDRKKAIIAALDELEEGEILLIAGKGHEEYQEIKGVKYPFSDFQIVMDYLKELEE